MRLKFLGAAGEVTGSATLVETPQARLLVDFGLHQGGHATEARNRRHPALDAGALDAMLLTHAHLDHCGRLPLLWRAGYRGPVYATPATIDLCEILLRDAAHIQEADAERANRARLGRGRRAASPLYTVQDAEECLKLLRPIAYEDRRGVAPGIEAVFRDAGHILGSASIQVTVRSMHAEKTIVFSGDVGVKGAPLLRDPRSFDHADYLVLESTYGDRDHRNHESTIDEFAGVLARARESGGKVLIPAFAVGRTQQLIYYMGQLKRAGRLDHAAVYVDSPMATEATELYARHRDLFDEATWKLIQAGQSPLSFKDLRFTRSAQESKQLNEMGGGVVIIAASGMCNGGRILHHLRHNLSRPDTSVVIVGFQAEGTVGRQLVNQAPSVRILGERIPVRARIHTLGGFSAHAGQTGLIEWAAPLARSRPRVFLNHGEDMQRRGLAASLKANLGLGCDLPAYQQAVEIA